MTYQKKATVYVLNTAQHSRIQLKNHDNSIFEQARDVLKKMLEEKVLVGRKTDMTGVILASTEDTDNELADPDSGQYQHIKTLCRISQPTAQLIRDIVNVMPSDNKDATADMMDALILATHTIATHCRTLKYMKQIVLLTDAKHPIDWRDIKEVQETLVANSINLVVVGTDFNAETIVKEEEDSEQTLATKEENRRQWVTLVEVLGENSAIYSLSEATDTVNTFYPKEVRPTPVYRGFLKLGDPTTNRDAALSISVLMYARTYEVKLPISKKWSTLADMLGNGPPEDRSHEVIMDRKYKVINQNTTEDAEETPAEQKKDVEVRPEDLSKVYTYGKTLVKVTEAEEEYLELKTAQDMSIIGFVDAKWIPSSYMLANVYVITAGQYRTRWAGEAISGLARALHEKEAMALVRYVSKANSEPKLGLLSPDFEPSADVLQFVQIPFADDIRHLSFSSLDQFVTTSGKVIKKDHPLIPDKEMLDSMEEFVKSTNLMEIGKSEEGVPHEYLLPEQTFNPTLWRLNDAIKNRALNDAAPIPEPHPDLLAQLKPVPELVEKTKHQVEIMKALFKVKKVDRPLKKRGYGAVKADEIADEAGTRLPSVDEIIHTQRPEETKRARSEDLSYEETIQSFMNESVREIKSNDPVKDFNLMVANTREDLVTEAVEQMGNMILRLVSTSLGDQNYKKVLECLRAMRDTAAKEDESEAFNKYLHELKSQCDLGNPSSRRLDFWQLVVDANMTLITKEEARDSKVTSAEAEEFLKSKEKDHVESMFDEEYDLIDQDDLLDML
ncbi:ATP-dependent DNA helicase II subunit 2 [Apophysomyces sp. BC1034]|nr:ATP-dependent DNA helicase II subunit 2 [Apophysomyces sp. BC1015]KAG0182277.1 ATP-dependent DNA helicase II subunit 2 [Apophysomyces sp. BC1021]KAG0192896.1 ATP-dependent DNA helicase II subunit 2 [Apophysomyces sp. BC1034]